MLINSLNISNQDKEVIGRRLVEEATGKNLSKMYSRLDAIGQLKKNWDGEGALPIARQTVDNIKRVLMISDDADWDGWMIGPETNATLGLQSKKTKACISVGTQEYSYYAVIDGLELHGNHLTFTPNSFLDLIRTIG